MKPLKATRGAGREALWGVLLLLPFLSVAQSHNSSSAHRKDQYVDANVPGKTVRVFAPGIVSQARGEGSYAERPIFSPDFRECFFDVSDYKNRRFTSYFVRYEHGHWSKPEPAFFSKLGGVQAAFGAGGKTLFFFIAPSPTDSKTVGIWTAQRDKHGWSKPEFLPAPINEGSDNRFVSISGNGNVYYLCATDKPGRFGVCRAKPENGIYKSVERIGMLQSSERVVMGDFFVAPDEQYIIIYSTLPDNLGQGDLSITFRRSDGTWSDPRNLGPAVNTSGYDFAPSISPDGRYIFFTRDHGDKTGDVYWISAEILEGLRR